MPARAIATLAGKQSRSNYLMATFHPWQQYADGRPHSIPCPSPTHGGDRSGDNCSVHMVTEGEWALFCYSHQCSYASIAEGLGLPRRPKGAPWEPSMVTRYDHPEGDQRVSERYDYPISFPGYADKPCPWKERGKEPCGETYTTKHKHFRQPKSSRGTYLKLWGENGPSYNVIIVVEGEKTARSLMQASIAARAYTPASWRGGAPAVKGINFSPVRGRDVILWPDNNDQGQAAMATAAERCQAAGASSIKVVNLDGLGLPEGGDAADLSAGRCIEAVEAATDYAPPSVMRPNGISPPSRDGWHALGLWYADRFLRDSYRYANIYDQLGWWWYDGRRWVPLQSDDPRLLDSIGRRRLDLVDELNRHGKDGLAELISSDERWQRIKGKTTDFWTGMRDILAGPVPDPKLYHVGTPSGVVDLRTGELYPHHPDYNIRAVTTGKYRPDESEALREAIRQRFDKVLDPETQLAYVQLVGLALTKRAQSYRPVVMIIGPSGSGKGDAANIALRSMGDLGMQVSREWLAMRIRNEIDAATTEILERQSAMVKVDELETETSVATHRLLELTGNTPLSSRRAYGSLVKGTIRAQVWTTAVSPPNMSATSGLRRRLAVLRTQRELRPDEIDEDGAENQDLLDAVLTLGAMEAIAFYKPGYRAPEGRTSDKEEALADMDEVAHWLESRDDLHQVLTTDALKRANEELEGTHTQTFFSTKITQSKRWKKGQLHKRPVVLRRHDAGALLFDQSPQLQNEIESPDKGGVGGSQWHTSGEATDGKVVGMYTTDSPLLPPMGSIDLDGNPGCGACIIPLDAVADGLVCIQCGAWWEGAAGAKPGASPTLEGQA